MPDPSAGPLSVVVRLTVRLAIFAAGCGAVGVANGCGACRPALMARISAEPWLPTVVLLGLPLVTLLLIALAIHRGLR